MSTELSQIKDAKIGSKISFIGVIIKQGDLKSGTKDGEDYTYKKFTFHDVTGDIELTAWKEDIKKFKVGGKYEVINAWCKDYKGKPTLGIQYADIKLLGTDETQSTMESSTQPKEEKPAEKTILLGNFDDKNKGIISAETVTLLMIRKRVLETIEPFMKDPNQGMVWQIVEKIYDKHFTNVHGMAN